MLLVNNQYTCSLLLPIIFILQFLKAIKRNSIIKLINPRNDSSNKGDFGHAFIVAGSKGKMGAAIIAAKACLRSGCGLLTLSVPNDEAFILQTTVPEAMLSNRDNAEDDFCLFSAVGIGPGLGISKQSSAIVNYLIKEVKKPIVLDADALNIVALNKNLFNSIPLNTILTPHPKEFDRLFGIHDTIEQRRRTAIHQSKEHSLVIVLKGHRTLVTNGEQSFLNTTGNAGLAKGGSGDALTGMITSFLAQGYPAMESALLGVYIHGLAADIALQEQSMESMLITDVIECIGKAFKLIKS